MLDLGFQDSVCNKAKALSMKRKSGSTVVGRVLFHASRLTATSPTPKSRHS